MNEAIELARTILKSKRSGRVSVKGTAVIPPKITPAISPKVQATTETRREAARQVQHLRAIQDDIDSWSAIADRAEADLKSAESRRDELQKQWESLQGPNRHHGAGMADNLETQLRAAGVEVERCRENLVTATRRVDVAQAKYDNAMV